MRLETGRCRDSRMSASMAIALPLIEGIGGGDEADTGGRDLGSGTGTRVAIVTPSGSRARSRDTDHGVSCVALGITAGWRQRMGGDPNPSVLGASLVGCVPKTLSELMRRWKRQASGMIGLLCNVLSIGPRHSVEIAA
jgi:hypothetical protein